MVIHDVQYCTPVRININYNFYFILFYGRNLKKMMRSNYEGCIHDWPSQRHHECLTEAKTMATYALDKRGIVHLPPG